MLKHLLLTLLAFSVLMGPADARVYRGGAVGNATQSLMGVNVGEDVTYNNGQSFIPSCQANTAGDLAVDASSNVKVSSTTYTFTKADIGHPLLIAPNGGGTMPTGWTQGLYAINNVVAGAAILATSPAATSVTGGFFTFGIAADCQYFHNEHLNLFRVAFNWCLMQPALNGPLNLVYLSSIEDIIRQGSYLGIRDIIEPHNFGAWCTGIHIGDPGGPTNAQFANFWLRMATAVKSWDVGYDLMNEPYNMATTWPPAAQAAINSIRTVDTVSRIYVEGNGFASAYQWVANGNNALLLLIDPNSNTWFSAHGYLDYNNSGSYPTVKMDTGPVGTTDAVSTGSTTITSANASAVNPSTGLTGFGQLSVGQKCYIAGGTGGISGYIYSITGVSTTSVTLSSSVGLTSGTGVTLNCGGPAVDGGCAISANTYQCSHTLGDQLTSPPSVLDTGIYVKRLTPFVQWCRTNRVQCWIGETGIPYDDVNWSIALDLGLQQLQNYGLPFTYWNGSDWSQCPASATNGNNANCSYRLSINPINLPSSLPSACAPPYQYSCWTQNASLASSSPVLSSVPMAVLTKHSGGPSPSTYQLYGPARGVASVASAPFQFVYNGYIVRPFTVTWSDNSSGGTFSQQTSTCAGPYNCVVTTTYTAAASAVYVISATTNNSSLSNPTGIGYATVGDQFTAAGVLDSQIINDLSFVKNRSPYIGPCATLQRASDKSLRTFFFSSLAIGSICDPAGIFSWNGLTEIDTVPVSGNVTVQNPLLFGSDVSVTYVSSGTSLVNVTRLEPVGVFAFTAPTLTAGQYYVTALGHYVFATADAAQQVMIKYLQPTFAVTWNDQSGQSHDGGPITQEIDGGGNKYPAVYGYANQPQLQLNCWNGIPCLYFNGTSYMDVNFPLLPNFTQNSYTSTMVMANGTMDFMDYGCGGFAGFCAPSPGSDVGVSVLNGPAFEFGWVNDTIINPVLNGVNYGLGSGGNWVPFFSNGQALSQFHQTPAPNTSYDNTNNNFLSIISDGLFHTVGTTFQDNVSNGMSTFSDAHLTNQNNTLETNFTASIPANSNLMTVTGGCAGLGPYKEISGPGLSTPTFILFSAVPCDSSTEQNAQYVISSAPASSQSGTFNTLTYFSNTVSYFCSAPGVDCSHGFQSSTPPSAYQSIGRSAAHLGYGRITFSAPSTFTGFIGEAINLSVKLPTSTALTFQGASNVNWGIEQFTTVPYAPTLNQNPTGTNTLPWMGWNDLLPWTEPAGQPVYAAQHLGLNASRFQIHWGQYMTSVNDTSLNSSFLSQIDPEIIAHTSAGILVLLDNHDGLCWNGADCVGGSPNYASQFIEFWTLMAAHYASYSNVAFDLANEPASQTSTQLQSVYATIISNARAAGFNGYIQLEFGPSFSSCSTYGVDTTMQGIYLTLLSGDPLHKLMLHCHAYFDDNNGGYQTNASIAVKGRALQDLVTLTQWANAHDVKLFWGEFGVGLNQTMFEEFKVAFDYIQANLYQVGVGGWAGWTAYGGGVNGWGQAYFFKWFPHPLVNNGPDDPRAMLMNTYATGHAWPCVDGTTGICAIHNWPYDVKYPYRN